MRDDAVRGMMLTNPHSPSMARGSFPQRNIDAWYTAFDVSGGKYGLKPAERTRIW